MSYTPPTHSLRTAGAVRSAELLDFQLRHPPAKHTVAQRLGIAYERKALLHLATELENDIIPHPAFRFNAGKPFDEHAIPDAIYISPANVLTIFEVKLRHSADAWYQLNKLYLPVVAKAYPGYEINLVEVVRSYDPSVRLAGPTEIIEDLSAFVGSPTTTFGIYLWSGRV